jgi:56kDa selenium binding protein (SBP56)
MRDLGCFVLLLFRAVRGFSQKNSYLFVWAGDDAKKSSDFLAVLDADPKSAHYAQVVASVPVPGPMWNASSHRSGNARGRFLLANAFES